MRLIFLFLTACTLVQSILTHAVDLNAYLDEKLRQTKREFIKIHIQESSPIQRKTYRVHWDKSWRVAMTSEHRPFTINMFDGIFILDGNRVMTPSLNESSSKETLTLREVDHIWEYSVIRFVKSIVWKNILYLLVCYEHGLCSLYTRTQNDLLRFRHTIGYRGNPVDAEFFMRDDRLYLVIANNADKFSTPSVIYRWSGTYMDVIGEVMTIGVESVTAFVYRQSTIIVFAQSVENSQTGSEVYEFKNNDDIVKIQFLSTTRPISIYHYVHGDFNFVLMINKLEPSSVLCWDGRELLDWFSLPEVKPNSLISIFNMDDDTFIVLAHDNIVQLFKFHSTSNWKSENIKRLEDGQEIVDMVVSLNKCTMTVTLVIKEKNVYWVEQWQAEISSIISGSFAEDADATRKCLADLIEMLQARMPAVKEAEASWEYLSPFAKNSTISKPIRIDNLILESGVVESIEVATEEKDIIPPHEIQEALDELDSDVNHVQSEWQKILNTTVSDVFSGKIAVDEMFLEELEIDQMQVDFVNDVDIRSEETILPEELFAKKVVIHNLEVDSLCGIPFQYWTFRNNTDNVLAAAKGPIEISNDTVIVHSDVTIEKLTTDRLNRTIINELIDNLFIINRNQRIKGQVTYKNTLRIANLTTQMLNGVPADKLMTTVTNQTFDNFSMHALEIENLYAERINGVPVEQAARKSRKNVIKGKVKLANLRVTENFVVDVNASLIKLPAEQPLQIYENVTIMGNLYLQNAFVERTAELFVGDTPVNIDDMFHSLWTKSSDQKIVEEITFENGLTIDRLDTKYLNNFTESDFLYTTVQEITSDFTNLHFANFHVNDSFFEEGNEVASFHVGPNSLTIHQEIHLQSLRATDVFTLAFNGIKIDSIMKGNSANFTGTVKLPTVEARRVHVDNLDLQFLNGRKVHFMDGLRNDDDHQIATLKVPEFHVQNLTVERLNGTEMSLLTRLENLTKSDLSRIVIDGDLTVEELTVDRIGGQPTEDFLEELAQRDIVITSEKEIENLIVQNITLTSLYGQDFDAFVGSVLSKSKEQTISGNFSARVIISDNVTTNFINGRNASELMWVDGPLYFTGNVTFTDLLVEGDVITSNLNGRNVQELYDSLLFIPAEEIELLKVNGNISWDTPTSSDPASMSYLMQYAVTKDTLQNITGSVTFKEDIRAWSVFGEFDEIEEIRSVISDTVIDSGEPIVISGRKFFTEDFVADSLTVNGDLGIPVINDVNILVFNNSVVRKDRMEDIGPLIFLRNVVIGTLRVNNASLNASIAAAARYTDVLPSNVFFEDLVVVNDVNLEKLDGINFDEFVNDRVTLSGDHTIFCDVTFKGLITVTDKANIKRINGINTSDFVLNGVDEVQIISGKKIFKNNLIVEGDVSAQRINDLDMIREYAEGVQNDEDVDIYGDIIFKAKVRIQKMNTSALVNGVRLDSAISDLKERTNRTLQSMEEHKRIIERNIDYGFQVSDSLRGTFFYLELEENPMVSGNNIVDVNVLYFENTTRLNLYGEQSGNLCGLSDDCPCPRQFVIEFSDDIEKMRRVEEPGEIVKNFYDPDGIFGVNVMTNVISSSEECTSASAEKEFTVISYMKLENKNSSERVLFTTDVSSEIEGYWRDVEIFKHDDDVYIVLAVYYNKIRATHRANSLFYKVDVERKELKLIQEIPTNGAWSVQIFKIDQREVYLLIGCFGEPSESLLLRFDPITQKFEQLRTFASRSRYARSLSQERDHFVLLDNPDTNAVDFYKYDPISGNFHSYQSIFHDDRVNGIECFYVDDFGNSDAFVIVTTESGRFYIYEYMFAGKFQMKLQHTVDGLRTMIPFYYMDHHFIFAGTYGESTIFRIIKQG